MLVDQVIIGLGGVSLGKGYDRIYRGTRCSAFATYCQGSSDLLLQSPSASCMLDSSKCGLSLIKEGFLSDGL